MSIEQQLSSISKHVFSSAEVRIGYSYDASALEFRPDYVVQPETTEEVVELLKLANTEKIPVYPRGAGSGFVGGSVPRQGGMVISLERMNAAREIDCVNKIAVVEPGVITGALRKLAREQGLFYPPEPSSLDFCTIGGNVSTDAGGLRTVKYGTTRRYVSGLELVLANGHRETVGGRFAKETAGYSLKDLVIGSEGTLALVTRAYLRLLVPPESRFAALIYFDSVTATVNYVIDLLQRTELVAACEYVGPEIVGLMHDQGLIQAPGRGCSLLLVEIDGSPADIMAGRGQVEELLRTVPHREYVPAAEEPAIEALWQSRKNISPLLAKLRPTKINEDICVPKSSLAAYINTIQDEAIKLEVLLCIFGHIADGNLHLNVMTDRDNHAEYERALRLVDTIFTLALAAGGTLSGEHGIGLAKSRFMNKRYSPALLDCFRGIKSVFDPHAILNPGKIFYG